MIIALIEDNDSDALCIRRALKGYTIFLYKSFEGYLKSSQDHDVVVSDYNMPDGDLETFEDVITKEECPFIIHTGMPIRSFGNCLVRFYKDMNVRCILEKTKGYMPLIEELKCLDAEKQK